MERERKKLDERMAKMGKEIEKAEGEYGKAANEGMGWSELAELEKGLNALKEKLGDVEERWMEIEEALEVL
jgi:chromosome segregation ATPase